MFMSTLTSFLRTHAEKHFGEPLPHVALFPFCSEGLAGSTKSCAQPEPGSLSWTNGPAPRFSAHCSEPGTFLQASSGLKSAQGKVSLLRRSQSKSLARMTEMWS